MKHLTTAQLAELLGMHPRSIADDRRDGSLGGIPFTRIGRAVRYRDDDVRQWLDQRRYIGGAALSMDTIRGTVNARDGEGVSRPMTRRDRDSRERPAQPMQRGASGTHGAPHRQAGSTPAPASISAPAGAVYQTAREGRR